ncbi:MAG: isoprenyl transferase [Planctomycetota bacterium]
MEKPPPESTRQENKPLPRHVAIIMDGNGRWATHRGMPRVEGHRRGVSTVRMVSETASEIGIEVVTLYCLSSENWKRPQTEIDFLMQLLKQYLIEERRTLQDNNMRLSVIGRRDRLPEDVLREMDRTMEMCQENTGTILVLAIDYGGRAELVHATRQIAQEVVAGSLTIDDIDEQAISDRLYTSDLPEVDLMIRTGGDLRVSNFLLWQISYAELYLTERFWPEFEREDFLGAIECFEGRQRRFGGLIEN